MRITLVLYACESAAGDRSMRRPESDGGSPADRGLGGGSGGGGGASARPVAVIGVGPNGVKVEPVFDRTKVALATITALGGMLFAFRNMFRLGRR